LTLKENDIKGIITGRDEKTKYFLIKICGQLNESTKIFTLSREGLKRCRFYNTFLGFPAAAEEGKQAPLSSPPSSPAEHWQQLDLQSTGNTMSAACIRSVGGIGALNALFPSSAAAGKAEKDIVKRYSFHP
jgi:hypothetical protein